MVVLQSLFVNRFLVLQSEHLCPIELSSVLHFLSCRRVKVIVMREIIADDADRLMSLDEVRVRLKTSPQVVAKLVNAGVIPVIRFRSARRVRKVAFNEFMDHLEENDLDKFLAEVE